MKPLDIHPKDLQTVQAILRTYVPDYEVRAFGSRTRQSAGKASDLDLAVMTAKPLGAALLADLREAFNQSDLPFKVDVLDWASISERFRDLIQHEFVLLQESAKS